MDTIFKTFKAEVKNIDKDAGTLDMYIPLSTSSIDRDGEVIEPQAFKKVLPKFMKHPVLVASHDYKDLTKQIGEWTKLKITDTGLEGKPKYYVNEGNPEADWAFNLASKGRAAFSVGFIPNMDMIVEGDGVKTPRRTYKELSDLLEISQCIIPSNRDAIQNIRSKSVDPIITELCDAVEKDLEITKPEETDEFIRIPVDSGNHEGHRIRTIEISAKEGISALYCGTDKVIMTYLFRKDKGWDMAKAKKWVKDHEGKSINELIEHKTSQEEIIDEIDYLTELIDKEGLSDKSKESFKELIKRLPGNDIPVEDKETHVPVVQRELPSPEKTEVASSDILESIKRINGGK